MSRQVFGCITYDAALHDQRVGHAEFDGMLKCRQKFYDQFNIKSDFQSVKCLL